MPAGRDTPFLTVNPGDAEALLRAVGGSSLPMGGPGQDQGPPGMGPTVPTTQVGGELLSKLQHPSVSTFERQFRRLPEPAWFSPTVSPTRSVKVTLGTYEVPAGMQLWLTDYAFREYLPGPLGYPSDVLQAPSGSLSVALAYQLAFTRQQRADTTYDVTPLPVQFGGDARPLPPGSTSAQGLSLLPARHERQGSIEGPFTIVLREQAVVQVNAFVLRQIRQPIVFLEGRISGYLLGTQQGEALLNRLRPR